MLRKKAAPITLPKPTKRNLAAKQARDQKAGVMKDKRGGRGGSKNTLREDLTQGE